MSNFSYGVIGLGKVGYAFSATLAKKEKLRWVVTSKIHDEINLPSDVIIYKSIEEIAISVDIVAIAVNDASIRSVAEKLSKVLVEKNICKVAFHFSGASNINLLDELNSSGVRTLSLHPMQTFGAYRDDLFNGIFWGVECEKDNFQLAEQIISDVGGYPYFLSEEIIKNKALYHSVGVAAANFLQGIIEYARLLCEKLQLPQEKLLIPILKTAFDNSLIAINDQKSVPITGPVARGDVEVIQKHIDSLTLGKFDESLYKHLVQFLAKLLFEQGKINEIDLKKILEISR